MRPSLDAWGLQLAAVVAQRATCLRRQVGCVLLNARGHVLATGYNGVAAGQPHCNEPKLIGKPGTFNQLGKDPDILMPSETTAIYPHACTGADAQSGERLDECEAIHAEANALLQCRDVYQIVTCYTTTSPCVHCVKLLLNTSCERIVFRDEYPHPLAAALWQNAGRYWAQLGELI